jgi:AhpD family alkylhydroperoxidase
MSYIDDDQINRQRSKDMYELIEDTSTNFLELHQSALAAGEISKKHKDLMALSIGIATRCEGCIISHVKDAIKQGATLKEIAETVEVAILMSGGPGIVYGGKAIAVAKEFLAERA